MLRKNITIPRRTHMDIIAEILQIAKRGARKTRIVYGANINFKLLNKYLNQLINAELITKNYEDNVIKTTNKGEDYLKQYKDLKSFVSI
jgi:predicted transcriptional regulator